MKAFVVLIAVMMAAALAGPGEARAWDNHGGFQGGFTFRNGPHHPFFTTSPFFRHRFVPHRRFVMRRPMIIRPPVIIVPPVTIPQVVVPPPAIIEPRVIIVPPPVLFPRNGSSFEEFGLDLDQ